MDRAKAGVKAKSYRHFDRQLKREEWWWYDPDETWPADVPFKRPTGLELPRLVEF